MIKAIIFDFDKVVYQEDAMFSETLNKNFNISMEKALPFFKNELVECQLGRKDLKTELEKYIKIWQIDSNSEKLMELWFTNGDINHELIKVIKDLKEKRLLILIITNNEKHRIEYMKEKYNLDKIFDKIITSYDAGARKPDKEIYNFAFSSLNLKPEECLYFDNSEENIETGKKLGFSAYIYKDIENTINIIKKFSNEIIELK